jgi:predicted DNA-binding antitoxin AbrB/MazE fold protein
VQVEAIFENGVLRPVTPLDLQEHERVTVEVLKSGSVEPALDLDCIDTLRRKLRDAGSAPSLDEVRTRLSKIPGSLTEDFIAEREDR